MPETKGTVLVVDDEEPVRNVASEILRHLGYDVMTASSGEEAVEAVRNGAHPDVILLDIIMPGRSGAHTLVELRAIEPDVPILITTGYADRATTESLSTDGATGFVPKPYDIATLAKHLDIVQRASKRLK
jgi:CheY-like chemotaxis protein